MNYTPKQLEILRLIKKSQVERGYSPTYAEIASVMDVSPVTIFEHIAALEKKGAIKRRKYEARSLEITDPDFDQITGGTSSAPRESTLPLVGRIAAGRPIEAIEDPEDVALGQIFLGRGETFMVERRNHASDGEIVVAVTEGSDATLKRIYRENGRIRLQPANSSMQPIFADKVDVQGVVRGIVRKCA